MYFAPVPWPFTGECDVNYLHLLGKFLFAFTNINFICRYLDQHSQLVLGIVEKLKGYSR
jgi:hypothetical protein